MRRAGICFIDELDLLIGVGEPDDPGVEDDFHACVDCLLMKDGKKIAPVKPIRVHAGFDCVVRKIDQRMAAVSHPVEAVDAFRAGDDDVENPHASERQLPRRLQENACADGADLFGLFEQGDMMALAGE
jgi:hypothetical protein